jgi:succinate dehydrogenase / fumarate reductase flavoprotein subunit
MIHNKPNDDLPAVHYTMGGTWVDYNLQTTICFSIGEIKLSDHGANRLGASA